MYLQALCSAFQAAHGHSLSQQIKRHFTGHLEEALVHAVDAGKDGTGVIRDAELLEAAMSGMGTKDEQLVYRITRAHWDRPRFEAIKQAYQAKYRKCK